MKTNNVIDKVRKLIALASSPHVEEARSAAFKAAALIREFNLDIVNPSAQHDSPHWVPIVSKYAGRCIVCREWYKQGESILWRRGTGCVHLECE